MLNLQKYNEERDEERFEYIKYWAYVMSSGIHGAELQRMMCDWWQNKNYQSHKDLYLKIAEEEVERLKEKLGYTKDNSYEIEWNQNGWNLAIQDQIAHWQSIINELTKE